MSDQLARGWDQPDEPDEKPLPLCAYHATVTERLSTKHSNQIARQAPCCVSTSRDATNPLV